MNLIECFLFCALQRQFGATPSPQVQHPPASFKGGDAASTDASTTDSKDNITHNQNLTNFLKLYNSEDNDSFEQLHAKDQQDRRRKAHWLYDDDSLDSQGQKRQAGMLMWYFAGGRQLTQADRQQVDRLLMSEAEEDAELDREGGGRSLQQQRPSQVDTWKFRVRNQLMFPPDLQSSRDTCALANSSTSTRGNQRQQQTAAALPPPRPATSSALHIQDRDTSSSVHVEDVSSTETSVVLREDSSSVLVNSTSSGSGDASATSSLQVERGKVSILSSSENTNHSSKKTNLRTKTLPMPTTQNGSSSLSLLETNASLSTYFSHLDEEPHIVHRNTRLKGSFLQDREKRDREGAGLTPLHAHRMSTPSSVLSAPLEPPHTPSLASSSTAGDEEWEAHYPHNHGSGGYNHNANYRPVSMTPSPLPAAVFTDSSSDPLLTWGSLAGMPLILDPSLSDLVEDAKFTKKRELDSVLTGDMKRRNRYSRGGNTSGGSGNGGGEQMDIASILPVMDINSSSLSDSFELQAPSRREQLLHTLVPAAKVGWGGVGGVHSSSTPCPSFSASQHSKHRRSSYPHEHDRAPRGSRPVPRGDRDRDRGRRAPLTPAAQALASKLVGSSVLPPPPPSRQGSASRGGKGGRDKRASMQEQASPFTFSRQPGGVEQSLRQSYSGRAHGHNHNHDQSQSQRRHSAESNSSRRVVPGSTTTHGAVRGTLSMGLQGSHGRGSSGHRRMSAEKLTGNSDGARDKHPRGTDDLLNLN